LSHKSGFVNIIGYPNVGKSTLLNALIDDRLSIITSKPQTTRHRILGIYNDDDHQIVFSDTPGIINITSYGMQESMNTFAFSSFKDADIMLLMTDPFDEYSEDEKIIQALKERDFPLFVLINKIDLKDDETIDNLVKYWDKMVSANKIFTISALNNTGVPDLLEAIKENLPEGPAYYPKDQLSDRNLRFFVSEIIREKILILYKQEVPYSCEVVVDEFLEKEERDIPITKIFASIYVSRKTQKAILIGKGGAAIKKLGIESRASIEEFLGEQIYLELNVKVKENWRDDAHLLKYFGYKK
jgi:GTP-binding protein Era